MPSLRRSFLIFLALALVMIATRLPGLAGNLHLHDASWAIFFIAGFYLADSWRWAFPSLMACAVGIDFLAIQYYGISNYCVTIAYWFLVPAYGALWLGGRWLSRHESIDARGLVRLALSALAAVSVCFLISNGSFYWLGGRVAAPAWQGWVANLATWYWPFVSTSLAYLAIAALAHCLLARRLPVQRISARAAPGR